MFHECLTGGPPFVAAHVAAVLAKILFEDAPPLRSVRPELPMALEDLDVYKRQSLRCVDASGTWDLGRDDGWM